MVGRCRSTHFGRVGGGVGERAAGGGRSTGGAAAARRVAARAGVRGGRGLPRPGQRRHEHRRRCPLRLPAGVGDRGGEPDGRARAVPVGEARPGHRGVVARGAARPDVPARAAGLLGAGGAGVRGHRPRRGARRGDRAAPAVRSPAARGRGRHHGRVDPGARRRGPARPARVRVRHHGDAGRGRRRVPHRARPAPARPRRDGGRAPARVHRHRKRAARRGDAGCHRDAARDLPALLARARPARTAGVGTAPATAADRDEGGRVDRAAAGRRGQPRSRAARGRRAGR